MTATEGASPYDFIGDLHALAFTLFVVNHCSTLLRGLHRWVDKWEIAFEEPLESDRQHTKAILEHMLLGHDDEEQLPLRIDLDEVSADDMPSNPRIIGCKKLWCV